VVLAPSPLLFFRVSLLSHVYTLALPTHFGHFWSQSWFRIPLSISLCCLVIFFFIPASTLPCFSIFYLKNNTPLLPASPAIPCRPSFFLQGADSFYGPHIIPAWGRQPETLLCREVQTPSDKTRSLFLAPSSCPEIRSDFEPVPNADKGALASNTAGWVFLMASFFPSAFFVASVDKRGFSLPRPRYRFLLRRHGFAARFLPPFYANCPPPSGFSPSPPLFLLILFPQICHTIQGQSNLF